MSRQFPASELWDELYELNEIADDEEQELTQEQKDRLETLRELDEELDLWAIYRGNKLIMHEDDFEDYAKEWAVESSDINRNHPMYNFIDWEKYADHIRSNFEEIEWENETYLYEYV